MRQRFLARYRRRITAEGEVIVSSDRFRDQRRNREDSLEKLRAMLAEVARPPKPRRPTRPGRRAVERRLGEKRRRAQRKRERRLSLDEE